MKVSLQDSYFTGILCATTLTLTHKELKYRVELLGNYIEGIKKGLYTPNIEKIKKIFFSKVNIFVIQKMFGYTNLP